MTTVVDELTRCRGRALLASLVDESSRLDSVTEAQPLLEPTRADPPSRVPRHSLRLSSVARTLHLRSATRSAARALPKPTRLPLLGLPPSILVDSLLPLSERAGREGKAPLPPLRERKRGEVGERER
ncbi:hypothetical protein E2562_019085 [Oryza meyeriana var. granulata]|uniref:Uncharacterized protein n=1 Tax=Oryza meyeriana var. granulata TaxID=110450 RepID=A0A6G1CRI3_9ORYZ|nr:hypothetical protein E2562_019085 [Oryza meyeriana var. granulata]